MVKKRIFPILFLGLSLLHIYAAASEDFSGPTSSESPDRMDTSDAPLLRNTEGFRLSRGAKTALGGIAMIGLLATQDQQLKNNIPKFISHSFKGMNTEKFGQRGAFERFGRLPGAAEVAGGFFLTGVVTNSAQARRTGVLILEAKLVNDFVTRSLKKSIGRERPGNQMSDGDEYRPFGGADSFPSGHTASAFAIASVIADNYNSPWAAFTSYGVASLVGVSRINQGAHWASDVAGGALVGYAVGKLISNFERRKGWSRHLYFEGDRVSYKKEF